MREWWCLLSEVLGMEVQMKKVKGFQMLLCHSSSFLYEEKCQGSGAFEIHVETFKTYGCQIRTSSKI